MKSVRLISLAIDPEKSKVVNFTVKMKTDREIETAMRAAVANFLDTKDGHDLILKNNEYFNWNDAIEYVPRDTWTNYGLILINEKSTSIYFNHAENLIPNDFNPDKYAEFDQNPHVKFIENTIDNLLELLKQTTNAIVNQDIPTNNVIQLCDHAKDFGLINERERVACVNTFFEKLNEIIQRK